MYSPITIDALRTLDAIDRRRSFAAAAEELYRVPSAISYTISKLEEDLGVELFDRSRRKAELTAVGRLILEQGRQILVATEELTALAKQTDEGWETELRICIDSLINCEPVYDLIEQFQKLQPRTELRLTEEVLGGSWDALNSEQCDLVIGAEGDPPSQGFGIHLLGQVEFVFAVSASHPLTDMQQPISLQAIQDYPTVVVTDSSRYLPVRSTGLLDGRSRIAVSSIEHKIATQIRGLGVGYLPKFRIKKELEEGKLKQLMLAETRSPRSISIAWRNTSKGKGVQWFVSQLRQMVFDQDSGLQRPK